MRERERARGADSSEREAWSRLTTHESLCMGMAATIEPPIIGSTTAATSARQAGRRQHGFPFPNALCLDEARAQRIYRMRYAVGCLDNARPSLLWYL